jgi:Zn-finger nucleic acid-binding protein
MWLEGGRLERLDAALGAGRPTDIDRLLAEILAAGSPQGSMPSACSVCRRELVRTELPHPGLVVSACPEQHGAWLNPDALGTLRRLVGAHGVSTRHHRRNTALAAGFATGATSKAC